MNCGKEFLWKLFLVSLFIIIRLPVVCGICILHERKLQNIDNYNTQGAYKFQIITDTQ